MAGLGSEPAHAQVINCTQGTEGFLTRRRHFKRAVNCSTNREISGCAGHGTFRPAAGGE
jgi:hypothetical protein